MLDGEVTKIVQIGNVMVAGGLLTQVADPMNGTPATRQNLFAFDATTGLVSQTFNPTVDGKVQQLLPDARRPTRGMSQTHPERAPGLQRRRVCGPVRRRDCHYRRSIGQRDDVDGAAPPGGVTPTPPRRALECLVPRVRS